jgi:hypothetical protein
MGGLIALRELINHRELLEKVPLVLLYATPQEGAQISQVANVVAKNPALAEMFPADRNAYPQSLDEDWKRLRELPARPRVICGYEKLPTFGVVVVPWSSATRFCDAAAAAIEGADHLSIVKPDRENHDSVVLLVNALNEHVLGKDVVARLETPDFIPEGNHLVFRLTDPIGRTPARLVNAGRVKLRYTIGQVSDPSLYLWPDDTPREIAGKSTQLMQLGLGFGATANEYGFVLQSDASEDRRVTVRVTDLAAFKKRQLQIAEAINNDILAYVSDPKNSADLSALGVNDARADDTLATVVANAVAKQNPDLPKHAQWVIAADFLSALNLPRVAATALRRAETLSPSSAKSSSVQWLGGVVAAQSGHGTVFASMTTPALPKEELQKFDHTSRYATVAPKAARDEVARQLKRIPAFRAYGWSLEGDALFAAGNKEGAKAAYFEAASIQKSPSIELRMERLDLKEPMVEKRATAKERATGVAAPATTRPAEVLKGELRRERQQ